MHAAFTTDAVDGDDVGMLQACGGTGFVLEALQMPRVHRGREGENLQGYPPAERNLLGFVDNAHAAPADFAEDAEVAQSTGNGIGRPVQIGGLTDQLQCNQDVADDGCMLGMVGRVGFDVRLFAVLLTSDEFVRDLGDE
jgi:hypothetical protein